MGEGDDACDATKQPADRNIPPLFLAPSFLGSVFLFGIRYAPWDFTLANLLPSTAALPAAGVDDGACMDGRIGSVNVDRFGLQLRAIAAAWSGRCN